MSFTRILMAVLIVLLTTACAPKSDVEIAAEKTMTEKTNERLARDLAIERCKHANDAKACLEDLADGCNGEIVCALTVDNELKQLEIDELRRPAATIASPSSASASGASLIGYSSPRMARQTGEMQAYSRMPMAEAMWNQCGTCMSLSMLDMMGQNTLFAIEVDGVNLPISSYAGSVGRAVREEVVLKNGVPQRIPVKDPSGRIYLMWPSGTRFEGTLVIYQPDPTQMTAVYKEIRRVPLSLGPWQSARDRIATNNHGIRSF